jgi:predicted transcriptional regulator
MVFTLCYPLENINNDTLEYSRVKVTMVYIFCVLAESLIFLLHLINTNKGLNYKHLYEQSLQQQKEQLKELNQFLQQENDQLNEMALLQQENIALMEELTKQRAHVNQLLRQQNDQLKENQQLLAENALLKERAEILWLSYRQLIKHVWCYC